MNELQITASFISLLTWTMTIWQFMMVKSGEVLSCRSPVALVSIALAFCQCLLFRGCCGGVVLCDRVRGTDYGTQSDAFFTDSVFTLWNTLGVFVAGDR